MKICRFDNDRLGLVEGDEVLDVSGALEAIPAQRWPLAPGDPLILNLERVLERARALAKSAPRCKLAAVKLKSPVANPTKIVNAPINYQKHIDEAKADPKLGGGRKLDYTAHGEAMNMAARFEQANKELGSSICVGPAAASRSGCAGMARFRLRRITSAACMKRS